MRLDGTIAQVQEREKRIQKFQTDASYSVFLLTTQVHFFVSLNMCNKISSRTLLLRPLSVLSWNGVIKVLVFWLR